MQYYFNKVFRGGNTIHNIFVLLDPLGLSKNTIIQTFQDNNQQCYDLDKIINDTIISLLLNVKEFQPLPEAELVDRLSRSIIGKKYFVLSVGCEKSKNNIRYIQHIVPNMKFIFIDYSMELLLKLVYVNRIKLYNSNISVNNMLLQLINNYYISTSDKNNTELIRKYLNWSFRTNDDESNFMYIFNKGFQVNLPDSLPVDVMSVMDVSEVTNIVKDYLVFT